jgi:hypothetical protein
MNYDETTIDNILVAQKDEIIRKVNNGEYAAVLASLELLAGLWNATGYHYKGHEIANRVIIDVEFSGLPNKELTSLIVEAKRIHKLFKGE